MIRLPEATAAGRLVNSPFNATARPMPPPDSPTLSPVAPRESRGRGQPRTPNLRDVAREAGVSVATVSLVLNNSDRISQLTRDRVRGVMRDLDYQPNRLAQSLSGKYVKTIAAMLPDLRHAFADAYFGELLSGITDEAASRDFKVLLEQAKPRYVKSNKHVELFERRYVDGVLLLGHTDAFRYAADFAEGGYPAVVVDNRLEWAAGPSLDYVASDYAAGAEQVMNCLLQLGHREIGLLHAATDIAASRDIREVWCQRLEGAGVAPCDSFTADGQFTEQGGAAAARRLLHDHPNLTALFAGNDKMAIGAMHYLQRKGIAVPGDVSVVGFDDLPHAAFVLPSLTTVHLPLYDVGRRACARLIERVEGRREAVSETLKTHLVLRDSTAIARTAARG